MEESEELLDIILGSMTSLSVGKYTRFDSLIGDRHSGQTSHLLAQFPQATTWAQGKNTVVILLSIHILWEKNIQIVKLLTN